MTINPAGRSLRELSAIGVLATLALAWAAVCFAILLHPVFVTNDSMSNYAHVWHVSEELWGGGGIPYRFPEIGHGEALSFPYAFLPWTSAALVKPLFGDWAVTLWLVLGAAGVLAATWWAFPELHKPLPFAIVLANPMLIEAVLLAQLPFLWATAMLFGAVAAWRQERRWLALLLMGAAQATHPAVVLPLAGALVLCRLPFEPQPRRLLAWYVPSVVLALPAVAMVFLSPVVGDSTLASTIGNFFSTVGARAFVVAVPFVIVVLQRRWPAGPALFGTLAVVVALNAIIVPFRGTTFAWGALAREPDTELVPFLDSAAFRPGATYRVLRSRDGKVTMYQVLVRGGFLDSEFFPESFARRSFASEGEYLALLRDRSIDVVIAHVLYDEREKTNEHQLLEGLVARGCATRVADEANFDVYDVTQCRAIAG